MGPRTTAFVQRWARPALLFAWLMAVLLHPATARAGWVEMHVARDDLRVAIASDGTARVEHRVLLLVSGGPLKTFTIRGVDPDAALEEGAYLVTEKEDKDGSVEAAVPLQLERVTVGSEATARTDVTVSVDGGRGVMRGRYVAVVRYKTDLVARGAIRMEGVSARIDWTGPSWEDGLESTRAVFEVPNGTRPPETIEPGDDTAGASGTFLTNVTRRPGTDLVEVVRPYASRGERVTWSLRLDAKAIKAGAAASPEEGPHSRDPRGDRAAPERRSLIVFVASARDTMFVIGGLALFVFLASIVAAHALDIRRRAAARDQTARPLVPLPIAVRAIATGALFLTGLWLELHEPTSLYGTIAIAACTPFIWHRTSVGRPTLRGPGAWLCVRVDEAFAAERPRPRGMFDAASIPGAIFLALLIGGFVIAGRQVAERSVYHGILIALDVVPLLALFLTGRAASFVPDPAIDSIPLLKAVVKRVEAAGIEARVIPRVRIPQSEPDPDELRVVFLPKRPHAGLRAIEAGVAFGAGPGGYVALPEVLVRFEEGSPCDSLVEGLEPFGKTQRGRKADERVLTFVPKIPTAGMTADLVLAILERTSVRSVPGNENGRASVASRRAAPASSLRLPPASA